jgi:hypothetical protein
MITQPGEKTLTVGDVVAGVYGAWGRRKAEGVVKLAITMHRIEFRATDRFVVS